MEDFAPHAALWSRPTCLDVTARYQGTIIVSKRIWDRSLIASPKVPVIIAFLGLMSAAGLMWIRNSELSVRSRHRSSMLAFAARHPGAMAFVPRLEADPLVEQGALALLLVAFAAGLVATVDSFRMRRSRRLLIGETGRCTIPVDAALLSQGEWPLLRATDFGLELRLPPGVTGSLRLGGQTLSLTQVRQKGMSRPLPKVEGAIVLRLPAACRVDVVMGPLEITVEDPLVE